MAGFWVRVECNKFVINSKSNVVYGNSVWYGSAPHKTVILIHQYVSLMGIDFYYFTMGQICMAKAIYIK